MAEIKPPESAPAGPEIIREGFIETHIERFPNGNIKTKKEFCIVHTGLYTEFYDSGATKLIVMYLDGLKHGMEYEYSETGMTMATRNYEKGKLVGLQLEYYETGVTKESSTYNKAQVSKYSDRHTQIDRTLYYEDGRIAETGQYCLDYAGNLIPHGRVTKFHPRANIKSYGNYQNGKPIGKHMEYFESGYDKAKLNYNNYGSLDGIQTYYSDTDPTEVVRKKYERGKLTEDTEESLKAQEGQIARVQMLKDLEEMEKKFVTLLAKLKK